MTTEDQRAVTARFYFSLARDTLLDEAAAKIGVDKALFCLIDGRNKCRVADAIISLSTAARETSPAPHAPPAAGAAYDGRARHVLPAPRRT